MKLKVLCAFGTRPEAVKMAPLVQRLKRTEGIEALVCVTAQHRRLLDEVLQTFKIRPDYDLDIMKDGQTLGDVTTRVLSGMERVLAKVRPDAVLVHGDTTTSFAAALAAFYARIPVGHVEAGLRTYNIYEPFPEEVNRRLTAPLATMNFAPTEAARQNLLAERVGADSIFVTGNTVIDVIPHTVSEGYMFHEEALNRLDYENRRVVFLTAHRRENFGKPFESIFGAVRRLAADFPDLEIVYPVHPNPVVRQAAYAALAETPRVTLTEPLMLKDAHNLMARSYLVLTDSGGMQEEAPFLDKPVLVLRNVTERPEGLATGAIQLAGTEADGVYDKTARLLTDEAEYAKMARAANPFGDGKASKRIARAILYRFGVTSERPADFAVEARADG